MKQALFYERKKDFIQCTLCPRYCKIKENKFGNCKVRKNINNKLISLVYGYPVALNLDPIEKKPLYHFLPFTKSLSLGTYGCNLHCLNCQNFEISQDYKELKKYIEPKEIVNLAIKHNCPSISYTYTEPVIAFEYVLDIMKLAKKSKIKNIIVSNGHINREPLLEWCKYLDATNIDFKSINDNFYKSICQASLKPVLETLKILIKKNIWLELTTLIIPNKNDSLKEMEKMAKWIKTNLSKNTPLHLSRFFPMYKLNINPTPIKKLEQLHKIASKYLNYVYMGNVSNNRVNTYCSKCNNLLISRFEGKLTEKCTCGQKLPGIWQ